MGKPLILNVSLDRFFEDALWLAAEHQNMDPHPRAMSYISGLMNEFNVKENLFPESDDHRGSETLAFLYQDAVNALTPQHATQFFRRLGDVAIFYSGFFPDQFNRKLVDIDYYRNMGQTGYGEVAVRTLDSETRDVFKTLSKDFNLYMNLLLEVSESQNHNANDLLRVYEKWLKTKNVVYEEKLKKAGIIPVSQDDTEFKH